MVYFCLQTLDLLLSSRGRFCTADEFVWSCMQCVRVHELFWCIMVVYLKGYRGRRNCGNNHIYCQNKMYQTCILGFFFFIICWFLMLKYKVIIAISGKCAVPISHTILRICKSPIVVSYMVTVKL